MRVSPLLQRRLLVEEARADVLRAGLTMSDQIGLALRSARRRSSESQRDFAARRGWSATCQARLETDALGQRLGEVVTALDRTGFAIAVSELGATETWCPVLIQDPTDLARWFAQTRTRQGVSTRTLAEISGVGQRTVVRSERPEDVAVMRLSRVACLVTALGGQVVLAACHTPIPRVIPPHEWPVESVLPRVRGGGRRLAAHGWMRRTGEHGPSWYSERHRRQQTGAGQRYDSDPFGRAPLWTAARPAHPPRTRAGDPTLLPGPAH